MWFRRRIKTIIKSFLVLCLLLFVTLHLYAILVRHKSPVDEPRLVGGDPGLEEIVPPRRSDEDLSLQGRDSVPMEGDLIKTGRRVGTGKKDEFNNVAGKFGEEIDGRVLGGVHTDEGEQVFRSRDGVNRTLFMNSQRRRLRTELEDIFISVKTTGKFHKTRLDPVLKTWFSLAVDQTYFFTDTDDADLLSRTNGHTINTNCSSIHSRDGLCCKMASEFEYFIKFASTYRWFCHVDDDTYVNIPALLRLLQQYDHVEDWYLGKPSLSTPLEIADPESHGGRVSFWFATGGAGLCISRGLALKMVPYVSNGRLESTCSKIRLPDDCSIGFILHYYLSSELTHVNEFHSHLELMRRLQTTHLAQQITLSYSQTTMGRNTVVIPGFDDKEDPTRFLSIHCFLFPSSTGCPKQTVKTEDSA